MEMNMADQVFIDATHVIPETGEVFRVVLRLRYGPNEADIDMPLEPTVAQEELADLDWPARLREMGQALLRIADDPSALFPPRPRPT